MKANKVLMFLKALREPISHKSPMILEIFLFTNIITGGHPLFLESIPY